MWLADFHIHTKFSDGRLNIPEIVDLYGKRGFGAIAITDHVCEQETIIGKASKALELSLTPTNFPIYSAILKSEAERAWKQYQMLVLPGFELSKNSISNKRSAHILAIGCDKFMWADGSAEDLCSQIHQNGGLTIAAHPVFTQKMEKQTYYLWDRRFELDSHIDAWEVASGPHKFEEVRESGLPMVANSDMHTRDQMSSWKTAFTCERHPDAIFEAIRNQSVEFIYYKDTHDTDR